MADAGAAPPHAATFHVRRATVADVPAVVRLLAEVAGEDRWIGRQLPVDHGELRDRFTRMVDDERRALFVADSGDALIGQLGMELTPYGVADLGMLVAAGWRGRGIGSALLAEGIAWARGIGAHKVALQVWPHNRAARALYEKFGFVTEGVLRRHYPRRNGELWDAVVMGLVLDDARPGSSME